jgi:hypothetical protein
LLVHVEDVVVHADDAAEKRHARRYAVFVLEALERIDDGGDDQERRHQAGGEDRQRELETNGSSVTAHRASCSRRREP